MIKQVVDGERGSEHRRQLLPSYKAHRTKFMRHLSSSRRFSRGHVGKSHQVISDVLGKCNVPVSFYVLSYMYHYCLSIASHFRHVSI